MNLEMEAFKTGQNKLIITSKYKVVVSAVFRILELTIQHIFDCFKSG